MGLQLRSMSLNWVRLSVSQVVSLVPNHAGGIFEVEVATKDGTVETVWSYEIEGGFPEAKVLKQRVRDVISPSQDLGHSDSKDRGDGTTGTRKSAVDRLRALFRLDRGRD